MEYQHIVHPFGPLYNEQSRVLILGSMPSPKSREQLFFYGHPQNRFWPLMAALFGEKLPESIEEKRSLALRHGIAIWDTILACDIRGAGDSSIRNAVPTDLAPILAGSQISHIFCNGKASGACYHRYQEKLLQIPAITLPSTSPANAAWTMERLLEAWKVVADVCSAG